VAVLVVDGYVRVVQLPVEYLKERERENTRQQVFNEQTEQILAILFKLNKDNADLGL
jgi:hypothetical protein